MTHRLEFRSLRGLPEDRVEHGSADELQAWMVEDVHEQLRKKFPFKQYKITDFKVGTIITTKEDLCFINYSCTVEVTGKKS